jgi:hypothetical protein
MEKMKLTGSTATFAFLEYCRGSALAVATILTAECADHFAHFLTFALKLKKIRGYMLRVEHFYTKD